MEAMKQNLLGDSKQYQMLPKTTVPCWTVSNNMFQLKYQSNLRTKLEYFIKYQIHDL